MPNNPRIAKLDFLSRRRGAAVSLRVSDVTATRNERGDLLVEVDGEWEGPAPGDLPPPVLVVDDGQRSHRFTALACPAPRGGPHTVERFRARFAVPDDLEACLVAPFVLFVGDQAQPLPDARRIERVRAAPAAFHGPGPAVLAERRADRAEQAEQLAHERADRAERELRAAEHQLVELERRLSDADELRRRAEAEVQEHERERVRELRASTQRVHAEQRLREEALAEAERLVRESDRELEGLRERSERALVRVRELESELESERRGEAEAQHAADAADAARERAERALADRERVFADALGAAEVELKAARDQLERADATALVQQVGLKQRISELGADAERLEAELRHEGARHAERAGELERRLAEERAQHERNLSTLRRQVQALHGQLDRTGAGFREQLRAERHARRALEAQLRALRSAGPSGSEAGEPDPKPEPWLPAALGALAEADPAAAGRLALALLPGQAANSARELDYDLELRDEGWFRVAVGAGAGEVVPQPGPRSRRAADFRVRADAAGLVALVAGGDASRLRIGATRSRSAARSALPAVPGGLPELHGAGARPDPLLLYTALASLIDPAWTAGHDFTVAQELSDADGGCAIVVRDGEAIAVMAERPKSPTATVRCTYATLIRLLSGQAPAARDKPAIRGDIAAVARLDGWLRRAQGVAPD